MPISFRAEQDDDGVVIEVEGSGPRLGRLRGQYVVIPGQMSSQELFCVLVLV